MVCATLLNSKDLCIFGKKKKKHKIKPAVDAQYKTVIIASLTYLLALA